MAEEDDKDSQMIYRLTENSDEEGLPYSQNPDGPDRIRWPVMGVRGTRLLR